MLCMHVWRPEIDVEYLSGLKKQKTKQDLSLNTPQSSVSQKLQCIFLSESES